ncbi:enoyl-CoA hydratase/isomerase family protein [Nocardioides sp. Soil777]|uniref:enoyl-CoA hydratase/isomerase family protein n=1 Tax=Nocardioides sp. Soil777 TaxID=1736409 RepID=UPI0019108A15|nr:enoyl-CoA hydratase/isomerase family protein [Nocardioides sp. Soil777]
MGSDGSLDQPAVAWDVVDLAGMGPDVLELLDQGSRLLVGVARAPLSPAEQAVAERLDLTFAPEGAADLPPSVVPVPDPSIAAQDLLEAVAAHPMAALTLRSLLRLNSGLDGDQGLLAESYAYSMLLAGPEFAAWLGARGRRIVPPPGHDLVRVQRHDGWLDIALTHPERRNAYSARLRDQLHESLRIAVADPSVTRVTLHGDGPGFCAGGDLDEFGTTSDPVFAHLVRTTAGAAGTLEVLRPRLEVRVHGACIGAGVELAAFAARVEADPGTTFRLPELAMGLIPGAGGTVSVTRRIGRWRTAYLGLSGATIGAVRAEQWGLVDEITP